MPEREAVVERLQIGAVFSAPFRSRTNSLDFHRESSHLVTAADDDCIQLFDVHNAEHVKSVSSRKYGCRCVTYTHHTTCILVASSKGPIHAVRYLSLHDNRWLRFFDGHRDRVTSLAMSPSNDLFLSAANDREVRLWDLRSPNCVAVLTSTGLPCCAFDQQGLVFGVTSNGSTLKLFDTRSYSHGSFASFALAHGDVPAVPVSCLKFSYDGQKILAVHGEHLYVLEAFEGHCLLKLNTGQAPGSGVGPSERGTPLEAAFTPDGKYVASGSSDRKIRIWNVAESGQSDNPTPVAALDGHTDIPTCLKWAPSLSMMASAGQSLAFWIP